MPEGHTLHRLALDLTETFGHRPIGSTTPQGRFADAGMVDGLVLDRAYAHGKHLFVAFDARELTVHVHLGLFGRWAIGRSDADVVGQVRWRIDDGRHAADLRGPTACEVLDGAGVDRLRARLGPDPLDPLANPDQAWLRISRSRAPIAALIMDQAVVSGVGNIYRAEVLFRQRVDPWTAGNDLSRRQWIDVWADLTSLMADGVEARRIDTVRPEHSPEVTGRAERDDPHGGEVYVYRRAGQPCLVCGVSVAETAFRGRNLFWCPRCQPPR